MFSKTDKIVEARLGVLLIPYVVSAFERRSIEFWNFVNRYSLKQCFVGILNLYKVSMSVSTAVLVGMILESESPILPLHVVQSSSVVQSEDIVGRSHGQRVEYEGLVGDMF